MAPGPARPALATARFLALALPAAMLVLGLVPGAARILGAAPDLAPLAARGVARAAALSTGVRLLALAFEATALVALFLLVRRQRRRPIGSLLDGLASGLAAWLFRGPVLVLAVAELTRLPTDPFWQAARLDLVALPAAGLAIGLLAHATGLGRGGDPS